MNEAIQDTEPRRNMPERCVVVVDSALPAGRAANAAAVLSLTVGQRHPGLVGAPLIDADGGDMPGLIPIGIAVLAAAQDQLAKLAAAADVAGFDVVRFPVEGQQTKNYDEFLDAMTKVGRADIRYVGLALVGDRKPICKLVGKLPLLGQEPS
ncbi:DUF2000 domain-containing protein [Cupriavidus sp. IDO]|uniref:DUF2000 domain-containing protein n=1 Tax=Cupriavidus sp. IDO TaxID=1539142 RepID=UPI0019310DC1|nr:DUF2000 domain-containing protein [Cupriavidus sp. IDO]